MSVFKDKYLNCLVMNALNKRRIDEKNAAFSRMRRLFECDVYSNAAFKNIFLIPTAFIQGRRLFEGAVYSINYGMYKS